MILLDTNIISELRKASPHGAVVAWYAQSPTLCLCAITIYELQAGVERTRQSDSTKAAEIETWVTSLQQSFMILPFTALEARITAALMRKTAADQLQDAMIAATALARELTIATRNTRDFERFGAPLINPFLFGIAAH